MFGFFRPRYRAVRDPSVVSQDGWGVADALTGTIVPGLRRLYRSEARGYARQLNRRS